MLSFVRSPTPETSDTNVSTEHKAKKFSIIRMDPKQNSFDNFGFQPEPRPPVNQFNPAAYPPSYPGQSVPQGPQGVQPVVIVPPATFVVSAPPVNSVPDYLGYSIFTMICCCLPLGIAALVYSLNTRNANLSGQRELAEKNSKTARTLNHVAVGLGIVFIIAYGLIIGFAYKSKLYYYHYP